MRRLALSLALASAALARAEVSLTALIRDHRLSATEAAAAVVLADALGLDATFVVSTGRQTGAPLVVLGPAFVISRHTGRPVAEVWKRKRGRGWGVVAKELGMHPGTFNKMRAEGEFDRVCWVNLLHRSHGVRDEDVRSLERQGLRSGDLLAAVVVAEGDRSRFKAVVADWKQHKGWKVAGDHPAGGKGRHKGGRGRKA